VLKTGDGDAGDRAWLRLENKECKSLKRPKLPPLLQREERVRERRCARHKPRGNLLP
jgi:hypothetical protein